MAVFMLLFLLYAVLDYYAEIAILENCKKCTHDLKEASLSYYNYLQQGLMNVVFTRIISMGLFFGVIYNLTLPLVIKLTLSYYRKHIESLKLSRDNIQLELNFLKSQVNPHFLFNTLNNLYGLIIHKRNEQSAETVARLSEFLRYSLYQSVQDNVPLEKEINLLNSYLQLEQLRLNYAKVIFEDEVDDQEYYLPPLLFMPIVENAFKYSPDTTESIIFIKLEGKNGRLNLTVKNSIQQGEVTITKGGIGLLNLKKRLSIYFPEKHMFEMKNDGKEYTARLSLFL
jgi:LytS/YehU family sensor histidine kinase